MSPGYRDPTVRLTVGQAILRFLQVQYSERDGQERRLIPALWGIYGHGNLVGLGQAMLEYGQDLPYHQPRNEQSMVHTAAAYAKAVRRLATLACTSSIGPGATNMVTGAALATVNRLPVLLLPSDYYVTRLQGPVLQQLEHPISADVSVNDCFRPVSRFFDRITRPEQLLTALPEAMRVLVDPAETGAVTLALPQDLQAFAADWPERFFARRVWHVERRPPETCQIETAVAWLRAAERPLIIAGGGVIYSEAERELLEFARQYRIPVGETTAGLGSLTEELPWFLGGFGTNGTPVGGRVAAVADLVLAIGTRLTDFCTGSQTAFQHSGVRFINLNVAGHDAHKQGALALVADARSGLRALAEAGAAAGLQSYDKWSAEVADWAGQWRHQRDHEVCVERPGERLGIAPVIGALNAQAAPGDSVTAAAGYAPGDLLKLWQATGGRRAQIEFGYSCMGYELPAGLGVRMAQPEGEVYVFVGDGSYLLTPAELATALQHDLKVTVVLIDNHGFQSIKGMQQAKSGSGLGNELRHRQPATARLDGEYLAIDYVGHAESLGARGFRARTLAEFRAALAAARAERRSCLIAVDVDGDLRPPGSGMYWDFEVAEVSGDPRVQALRADLERQRLAPRYFG